MRGRTLSRSEGLPVSNRYGDLQDCFRRVMAEMKRGRSWDRQLSPHSQREPFRSTITELGYPSSW